MTTHPTRLVSAMFAANLIAVLTACATRPAPPASATPAASAIELRARFIADRIFVLVPVRGGDTLDLYTDTGGGLFVVRGAATRVGWRDTSVISLREIAVDSQFPVPLGAPGGRMPVLVPPPNRALDFDGMLGQAWFADRVWTFDYAARRLLLHPHAPAPAPGARSVPLGFQTDSSGKRTTSFPRIAVVVDGDTLQLLFDTGATGALPPAAVKALGDSLPPVRATSFITTEVLNRWHERHPQWRVLANADETIRGMRMIEVPEVSIAGVRVGPVWFTERPDANFHQYMSQWMDRRVDGALGGNALRFFRVTVHYPAAVAHFVPVAGR
ncbi:MAG TPA: hypothetical protein VFZ21_24030 [Gemmatimonadaceae bacterium]|nr:hypothetical protein [Gemmatimonadaceae bacterium]